MSRISPISMVVEGDTALVTNMVNQAIRVARVSEGLPSRNGAVAWNMAMPELAAAAVMESPGDADPIKPIPAGSPAAAVESELKKVLDRSFYIEIKK